MKFIVLFLTFFLASLSFAQDKFISPDIILDSKLDSNWSEILFTKIRKLMKNYGYDDPLKSTVKEDIILTDSIASDLVSKNTKDFLYDLGDMIGLRLVKAHTKIKMNQFSYDIDSMTAEVKTSKDNGLILNGDFQISGIKVNAKSITFSVEIPQANTHELIPVIEIKIKNPKVETLTLDPVGFSASIKLQEEVSDIKFKVMNSSFENMSQYLVKDSNKILMNFGEFEIPEIEVQVGRRVIKVSPEKVEKFIRDREESIKTLLVEQFVQLLDKGVGNTFLKAIEDSKLSREHWLLGETLQGQIIIGKIASSMFSKNLEVNLPGDFCTKDKYDSFQTHCVQQKTTHPVVTQITKDNHIKSLEDAKGRLSVGESNLVASVSEGYLNKLLVTTYDAGYWNEFLKEKRLELGPKKIFVLLDEKGETGTLYVDLIYTPSKFQGILIGRKRIRFPLIMKVSLRIDVLNSIPVLLVKLHDVDLRSETLLSGLKLEGLESTIGDIPRFKKAVLKNIRKAAQKSIGKDIVSLPYKELKGLGLETVTFRADGEGRMAALMKLEDLKSTEVQD